MSALRRILLVVYSLLLLAAVGGIASLAWDQDEQLDLNINSLNIQAFVESGDSAKYALTAVLAAIGAVALLTIVVALWPSREGKRGALKIKQSDGGYVEVTPRAIEAVLRDELEALPEVRRATPKVRLAGGAVDTHIDADIEPSSSIAHATKLLSSTVESVLREHVGVIATRRPVIRINYDEAAARPIPNRSRMAAPPPPVDGNGPANYESKHYPDEPGTWQTGLKPQQAAVAERPVETVVDETEPRAEVAPAPDIVTEVPDAARPPEAPRFVSSAEEVPPHDDRS